MGDQSTFYGFRERGKGRRYQSFAIELVAPWRCQLRCRYCYKGEVERDQNSEIPEKIVLDMLEQARECGFSEAIFMGGEPTLHPQLVEFVQHALSIGLSPIVVTNGVKLARSEYAEQIALPGVTLVMHAPLPEEAQDQEVQVPGYSRKLIRAYNNVTKKKGVTIVAEVVAIRRFLPHMLELYELCQENGVIPFIEFSRNNDAGKRYCDTISPEEVAGLFQQISLLDPGAPEVLLPPAYGQTCSMTMTGVHVKNFGKGDYGGVYSCCAQGVRHGDLLCQPLTEILEDSSFTVFKNQDEWIFGPCRTCQHYPLCHGGCRGQAYQVFGCPRASSPFCWHLSSKVRNDPVIMMPSTCTDCPLEGNPACHPRR